MRGEVGAIDFNPRAPYGARPARKAVIKPLSKISIHAPHTGRDAIETSKAGGPGTFQSTRPIRGATILHVTITLSRQNFNPRAPYGARLCPYKGVQYRQAISIHAPHTGRDVIQLMRSCVDYLFQSTRPIRGATSGEGYQAGATTNFNPRAPYGARQTRVFPDMTCQIHFNPRAPYGARPNSISTWEHTIIFQSTRPIRGATVKVVTLMVDAIFQSTRPIRGATISSRNKQGISSRFQSTRPIRGATL